jgi:ATP-dependent RNA helicase RhlE
VRPRPVNFTDLGLSAPILEAVARAGYSTPTPIQQGAVAPALLGRDILGVAQTGTGKTAAFCLPLLQRIHAMSGDEPALRALILTPTRELAAQINESLATYGQGLDLWHTVIFGGVPEKPQIQELHRGVDILVATPGRLMDLMNRGIVSLSQVQIFVLDEADRMLDMGFLPDVKRVVAALPQKKQTLFFSATMPPEIRTLADRLLQTPEVITVTPVSSTVEQVEQSVYFVDQNNKRHLLVELLTNRDVERCIVFSRTKHGANRVVAHLAKHKIHSAAIHGNKSQGARVRAMDGFRSGELRVLVATDLAARGIDVDGVTHVINFDIPNVPETYVHRIGRTARAGRGGTAWSLCDQDERPFLVDIERLIQRHLARAENKQFPPGSAAPAATDLEDKRRPQASSKPAQRQGRPQGSRPQGQKAQGSGAERSDGGRAQQGDTPRAGRARRPRRGRRPGTPRPATPNQ